MNIREMVKSSNIDDVILLGEILCVNHNVHRVSAFISARSTFTCNVVGKKLVIKSIWSWIHEPLISVPYIIGMDPNQGSHQHRLDSWTYYDHRTNTLKNASS